MTYDYRSATAVPNDFAHAKARQAELEASLKRASDALKAVSGERGPMGMTPDAVKATPEWKAAKRESEAAFAALRNFNAVYVSRFKRELDQERAERHRR